MSRRSMVGAGLLAVAGVLYATGPTEQREAPPVRAAVQALVTPPAVVATPPKDSQPKASPAATSKAAEIPSSTQPVQPAAAPEAPRMINGPTAATPRVLPKAGPKNDDVPPTATAGVAVPAAAAPTFKTVAPPKPVATATAEPSARTPNKPARRVAKFREPTRPGRSQPIMTADASPLPRQSPAPRVQW